MASAQQPSDVYEHIYAVVRRIPKGRVATYGQVASLASLPGRARQVGYALHALADSQSVSRQSVPWHRVINAQGRCSARSEPGFEHIQQQLLEAEGVAFEAGRTSLDQFRWEPRVSGGAATRPR